MVSWTFCLLCCFFYFDAIPQGMYLLSGLFWVHTSIWISCLSYGESFFVFLYLEIYSKYPANHGRIYRNTNHSLLNFDLMSFAIIFSTPSYPSQWICNLLLLLLNSNSSQHELTNAALPFFSKKITWKGIRTQRQIALYLSSHNESCYQEPNWEQNVSTEQETQA